MRTYDAGDYDVAVVGAGHAGIEAALAAARLGCRTICFAVNLDSVGNMPCNPAIGGTAKGHLVREVDALGGEMGRAADATAIQFRMLNRGKGPAVYSLRAQADRRAYQAYMKRALEGQEGLDLVQGEVVSVESEEGRVRAVVTRTGARYRAKTVVICTGTFLGGRIIIGELSYEGGPDGMFPSVGLGGSLRALGLSLRRFKTGTPPRVNRRTVDFSRMEIQEGDKDVVPFSFLTEGQPENRAVCHLTYTTPETHGVIRANLDRSPLFSGAIEGVGPRYCPSIEDKVVRFADKERHQLFIEPMGLGTDELYVQGFSSSMPAEVQEKMLRSVTGLEKAHIMRYAYAIEYDCVDPTELTPSLEAKKVGGLFGAGQFCGTSGYEEAASLGIVAGINAARSVKGEAPFVVTRSDGYIGTLIDDLVTKGTNEPYRMMTSRSEYRLVHRQDNADERMTPKGFSVGLASEARMERMREKYRLVGEEIARLSKTAAVPSLGFRALLEEKGSAPLKNGALLADLLRRPELSYADLAAVDPARPALPPDVCEQAEIRVKYEGYIRREEERLLKLSRMEARALPPDADYASVKGLRIEARQKLEKARPLSVGQAASISGVSPADITVLLIWLEGRERGEGRA